MRRKYAIDTTISVEQSKREIESMLQEWGASEFTSGWTSESSAIGFVLNDLRVRFVLPYPDMQDRRFTHKKVRNRSVALTLNQREVLYQKELRARWRALLLTLKAKLVAVDIGITTLESEMMAFVVMPDNSLMGDWISDTIIPMIKGGNTPKLIGSGVQDAEIIK